MSIVILAFCVLHFGVLPYVDRNGNAVLEPGPYPVSNDAAEFHSAAFVADLHADPLLWGRDLRIRYQRGHMDLPRLREAGVDLQVFSVVTKVPRNSNYHSTPQNSDSLPLLFVASLRSPATWFSAKQRALAQAQEFTELTADSSFSIVLGKEDLEATGLKGLLALEGLHALESKPESLAELHAAGFRMMGLAHHFDNAFAGSAHGVEKYGLTKPGRALIPRLESMGITIDLAHASVAAFNDSLELARKPVVVSHGGVKGTCPGPRNLSDEQLRAVTRNGGVIGIGYWRGAVCDPSVKGIVAAILHAVKIAGIDHVGLGSDFDGYVKTPFDTTGLPMLTEALLATGLSRQDVRKLLGENVRRVLAANLPS